MGREWVVCVAQHKSSQPYEFSFYTNSIALEFLHLSKPENRYFAVCFGNYSYFESCCAPFFSVPTCSIKMFSC